jgi:hypothetical protein
MAELERELHALRIELPPEPDLAPRVRAALGLPPRRRHSRLVLVAAALAVALGAAFAVPDSGSALLRFFGIQGATVVEVGDLPKVGPGPLAFGERTSLAGAQRLLGFRPLLPDLGRPDAVYVDRGLGYLIALYGGRLRLSEFRNEVPLLTKLAGIGGVQRVDVDGHAGLFVPANHVVFELGRQPRLAADTHLRNQGGLTIRLEGRFSREKALALARSVR